MTNYYLWEKITDGAKADELKVGKRRGEEMSNDAKPITVVHDESNIEIRIPIDTLSYAQSNRPNDRLKITDKMKMASYVVENLVDYGSDELGETDFYRLIDNLIMQAHENGEFWVSEKQCAENAQWKER